jgi:hypothetical protein
MIFERIRAFVSSSMEELEPERLAVKQALDELKIDAWLFERDAGARPESPAATFREELGSADIYVGLFANKYGAYTVEEFELATTLGKDRLVYERRSARDGRDPRLEAFLARAGHVENGLTIRRFENASQLGAMVKDDLAAWQARRIRDQRTEMAQRRPSPGRDVEQSQLEILRRKVEQFWVEGVLKHSLYDEVLIDLGTEATTEAIDHPWATVLELPDHSTSELSSTRKIADIFEEAGRSLLVLGEPGAGKTTCLLDLARSLLATEHEGITPVVLNLSSFGSRSGPLFDWLIEEIPGKYQIPKQLCRRWLTEGRLLLLLDGLDEVNESRRADCVRAINVYAESQAVPGLVVCSRVAEYVALPVRIKAWGAIRLRPLEAAQIQSYLARIGPRVAGLTSALDSDESLRSLATSPLLLNLMALAYADAPPEAPAVGAGTTPEQRRYALFDRYIQTMFARKGVRDGLETKQQTIAFLAWLARAMRGQGVTEYLVEQMQPSWLTKRWALAAYVVTGRTALALALTGAWCLYLSEGSIRFAASAALSQALVVSLFELGLAGTGLSRTLGWLRAIGIWIASALVVGVVVHVGMRAISSSPSDFSFWSDVPVDALGSILIIAPLCTVLALKARLPLTKEIETFESVGWSWRSGLKRSWGGVAVALGLMLLVETAFSGVAPPSGWMEYAVVVAVGWLAGFGLGGVQARALKTFSPNQGIRRTVLRAALVFGGCFGMVLALSFGVDVEKASMRLAVAYIAGALGSAVFGGADIVFHYVLRLMLVISERTPRRLIGSLKQGVRLVFLRQVGGGFIFVHRLLLEYFAGLSAPAPRNPG